MASDLRGINANNVGKIKQAIDEWMKAVEACNFDNTTKDIAKAIKGSGQEAAFKKLCQSCASYRTQLTGYLRNYSDVLDTLKQQYVKNDSDSQEFTQVANQIKDLRS